MGQQDPILEGMEPRFHRGVPPGSLKRVVHYYIYPRHRQHKKLVLEVSSLHWKFLLYHMIRPPASQRPAPPQPLSDLEFPFRIEQSVGGDEVRRAVATRDIEVGEIVLRERALCCHGFVGQKYDPALYEHFPLWVLKQWLELPLPSRVIADGVWPLVYVICKCAPLEEISLTSFYSSPKCSYVVQRLLSSPTTKFNLKMLRLETGKTEDELIDLYLKVQANAFVLEDSMCPQLFYGAALFRLASFFNHSCLPNLGRYFDHDYSDPLQSGERPWINLYACKRIAAGEELTIPYSCYYDTMPRELRSKHLGFRCLCAVCTSENKQLLVSEMSPLSATELAPWTAIDKADDLVIPGGMCPEFLRMWRVGRSRSKLLRARHFAARQLLVKFLKFCVFPNERQLPGTQVGPTDDELADICRIIETELFSLTPPARAFFHAWRANDLPARASINKRPARDQILLKLDQLKQLDKPGTHTMLENYIVAHTVYDFCSRNARILQSQEVCPAILSEFIEDLQLVSPQCRSSHQLFFRLSGAFELANRQI